MIKHYKKVAIKKLKIDKEFDYQSIDRIINLDSDGVNTSINKINTIRKISNLDPIQDIFEANYKITDVLNINKSDRLKWEYLIGKIECVKYTKSLLKEINFSKNFITSYHTEVLPRRSELYKNLTSVLDASGKKLPVPTYSHSSVSGRTTITSGFNFLTSSKEFRENCSSVNSDMLVSIDFKACEPNLYLRAIGKNIKNSDVYNHLMTDLDIKVENRSQLKRGILSVLYGAADDTAKRILGGNTKSLEKIKEFFEIEKTTEELRREFDKNKFIFNMYGRPIFSDKSILNKWIQSSAVDFCSLAFLHFSKTHNLSVAYLVHDDMVVNCSKEQYDEIKNITQIKDPRTNLSLPVEITVLSR